MCATCGCNTDESVKLTLLDGNETRGGEEKGTGSNGHDHHHHDHHHDGHGSQKLELEKDILHKNDLMAQRIRGYLEAKNIIAINLVSSPGSGKTTLLEKTIQQLKGEIPISVIEGDQQSTNDARRIQATGARVVQINTGNGCHLDAEMIHQAIDTLAPKENSLLFIENVGNLVCPALFDLGENKRVVIISVTEGTDKPEKYPNMFASSSLCIFNKVDLLPHVDFDLEQAREYALRVNHHLHFIETSALNMEGMDLWMDWLKKQLVVKTSIP